MQQEMEKESRQIINETPHPIKIVSSDGVLIKELPASRNPLRVTLTEEILDKIDGVPITKTNASNLNRMVIPAPGVYYVVSTQVKRAYPERDDFLVPQCNVRGERGEVVASYSLGTNINHERKDNEEEKKSEKERKLDVVLMQRILQKVLDPKKPIFKFKASAIASSVMAQKGKVEMCLHQLARNIPQVIEFSEETHKFYAKKFSPQEALDILESVLNGDEVILPEPEVVLEDAIVPLTEPESKDNDIIKTIVLKAIVDCRYLQTKGHILMEDVELAIKKYGDPSETLPLHVILETIDGLGFLPYGTSKVSRGCYWNEELATKLCEKYRLEYPSIDKGSKIEPIEIKEEIQMPEEAGIKTDTTKIGRELAVAVYDVVIKNLSSRKVISSSNLQRDGKMVFRFDSEEGPVEIIFG